MTKKPKAIVTSGATWEALDPVRGLTNRSSGRQGHAIAEALNDAGYDVVLVSGITQVSPPSGVRVIKVESAREMLDACLGELPADIAICVAAVADWRPKDVSANKMKKASGVNEMTVTFVRNPDILETISKHKMRPKIVVGFAAETENLLENAQKKLEQKGCDMIVANNVSRDVFAAEENEVILVTRSGVEELPRMGKGEVALMVVEVCNRF